MDSNSRHSDSRTFSLRHLLGENITIVVPDMQRDYCWGSEEEIDKVATFVGSLLKLYVAGRTSSLGLLYGYESPEHSGHIHIIDGQQRLTTLYLLVGMLYRRTPRTDLRRMLISDFELLDDKEPRLLYEARTEAMYFMSELVTHFFLDRDGRLSQLEKSEWYCSTYSTDPTVRNFIRAIRKIDETIENICHKEEWNFNDFADFVADRLVFFYHEMRSRRQGEEMFLTINTTGEPLTFPQKLKAQLVPDTGGLEKWEEMEQWAWLHRRILPSHQADTSDPRMTALVHIHEKYTGKQITDITAEIDNLYRFFKAYCILCECEPYLIDCRAEDPGEMFVVLPAVKYIRKWNLTLADRDMITDLTGLLCNITRYQRISPQGTDTEGAFRVIEKMATPDLLSLLEIKDDTFPKILSEEEISKLRLITSYPDDKLRVSQMLRKGERHPLLYGKLQKVIDWSTDRNTNKTDLHRLGRYIDSVYEIWGTEIDKRADLDELRRALLTLRHNEYPMHRRADSTLSLCWHEYEWQRLMALSPGVIRQLIDKVEESRQHPADLFRKMTGRFEDKSYPFFFLISSDNFITKCLQRRFIRYCEAFIGYYIEEGKGENTKPMTHWLIDGRKVKIDLTRWAPLRPYGARCLYTDHRRLNVSVDIHYLPDQGETYRIEVFNRDESIQKEPFDIRKLLNKTGRKFSFNKKTRKYFAIVNESRTALGLVHSLLGGC